MAKRIGGLFDYREWSERRAAEVGARRALDEAVLVFGRAMVRGFVLACVPMWPAPEGEEDFADDGGLPAIHDPDRREFWTGLLHIGGLFWNWARHPPRRTEITSSWPTVVRSVEERRRSPRPRGHYTEWVVAPHLRGPSAADVYDGILAEDVTVLPDVIRPAIAWNLVFPGLVALEADAEAFDTGMSVEVLADGPLWLCAERPNGWPESWSSSCDLLRSSEADWAAPLAWIDGRLRGDPMDAATDVALFARAWPRG